MVLESTGRSTYCRLRRLSGAAVGSATSLGVGLAAVTGGAITSTPGLVTIEGAADLDGSAGLLFSSTLMTPIGGAVVAGMAIVFDDRLITKGAGGTTALAGRTMGASVAGVVAAASAAGFSG